MPPPVRDSKVVRGRTGTWLGWLAPVRSTASLRPPSTRAVPTDSVVNLRFATEGPTGPNLGCEEATNNVGTGAGTRGRLRSREG